MTIIHLFLISLLLVGSSFQIPTNEEKQAQPVSGDESETKMVAQLNSGVGEDTAQEKNLNEVVVDDSKLGSVLNLNEKPYFTWLNNEELSSDLEVNIDPIRKIIEENDELYNDDLNIFNEAKDEKETNEGVKSEIESNEILTQLSSETKEADSNLGNESKFLSLIIAFNNLPTIDENNDDETMVNNLKEEQNEQQYEFLTNEINMLSVRLSDMEKLLIQSFQLNLMIILMFILGTSLILFRAFFMNKRNHKIVFHASNRNGKVLNANGDKVPLV